MASAVPAAKEMFSDAQSPSELSERMDALVKAATDATVSGLSGETVFEGQHDTGTPTLTKRAAQRDRGLAELAKSADPTVLEALREQLSSGAGAVAKEWSLTTPINTGLVPFDLEAEAKLLTPRPTPFRNIIPRTKGQGAAKRFKVISGFTGTGTGGVGTLNGGISESTTNVGPGGLSYVRPPYISYAGYDSILSYVSWGLSDSVSWQAEYQGQGFEDIRSLSNTALLYSTMLLEERLMCYGRGASAGGYAGALAAPSSVTAASVAGSAAPAGSSSLAGTTYWFVLAADAGDLLGTTGALHQSATTAAASVTVHAGNAIQYTVGTDASGALGYNAFIAASAAGPFYYAGRTGYNVGYITSAPVTGASVAASAADASAVSTNFDGLLTNVAANGGYVNRINTTFSTANPGVEYQTAFSSLFDAVKADPDEIWLNGHDRNQLSNALLSGANVNNYQVFAPIADTRNPGVVVGAIVQGVNNQITGKEVGFKVHPWFPQGNSLIRSTSLPIPDTNVTETSVMSMVQDYVAVQWPVQQFTYDSSTFEIGTMTHYAPAWSALIQGIEQDG